MSRYKLRCKNEKKNYGPFSWMGFNYLKARATLRRQFNFYKDETQT